MDLKGIDCEGGQWIHLAQNRNQWWAVVNAVMNVWGSIKRVEFLELQREFCLVTNGHVR
jgi:hypothetical protein